VPFYRWMLAGDVFYIATLFSCWAVAGFKVSRLAGAVAPTEDK
jgi:hypothetical protein